MSKSSDSTTGVSADYDDGSVGFRGGVDGFISELLPRLRSIFARILAFHADAQCVAHLQSLTCRDPEYLSAE